MNTYMTAEFAVNIVIELLEAEGITEETSVIRKNVYDWYIHTDLDDPEMLAACAVGGGYIPGITYSEIKKFHEYWFPQPEDYGYYYDQTSIYDIEAAMADGRYFV